MRWARLLAATALLASLAATSGCFCPPLRRADKVVEVAVVAPGRYQVGKGPATDCAGLDERTARRKADVFLLTGDSSIADTSCVGQLARQRGAKARIRHADGRSSDIGLSD